MIVINETDGFPDKKILGMLLSVKGPGISIQLFHFIIPPEEIRIMIMGMPLAFESIKKIKSLVGRIAAITSMAESPLTNTGCRISLVLKHLCNCQNRVRYGILSGEGKSFLNTFLLPVIPDV